MIFPQKKGYLLLSKCICTNSSQKFSSDEAKSGRPKSQYVLMFRNKPGGPLKVVDAQNGNFNRTSFVDTTYWSLVTGNTIRGIFRIKKNIYNETIFPEKLHVDVRLGSNEVSDEVCWNCGRFFVIFPILSSNMRWSHVCFNQIYKIHLKDVLQNMPEWNIN